MATRHANHQSRPASKFAVEVLQRKLILAFAPLALLATAQVAAAAALAVTKTATCGCCADWVKHMRASGFDVTVTDVADVMPVARRFRVPDRLRACHTAEIAEYAIEGACSCGRRKAPS